jgi:hypothetical protein
VIVYVPAGTFVQASDQGSAKRTPIGVPLAKNSTLVTDPSGSVAVAAMLIVAGAVNVAPSSDTTTSTPGG